MIWLWNFVLYSFVGFLLETAYAFLTGGRTDRKGLRVLPLCPVYGVGACLILLLPERIQAIPWALFLLGGLAATVAEYTAALYHEKVLKVRFWNYDDLPGNIRGRVCLPFSLIWGALALGLVRLHSVLLPRLTQIPAPVSWLALITLLTDGLFTAILLRYNGDTACLRWGRL